MDSLHGEVLRFDVNNTFLLSGARSHFHTISGFRQVFHVNRHQCDISFIVAEYHRVCCCRLLAVILLRSHVRYTARIALQRTDYIRMLCKHRTFWYYTHNSTLSNTCSSVADYVLGVLCLFVCLSV